MGVMEIFRLDDKVVIVTGASSGLGVAFAHCFAEAGADVVLGARRVEKLERVAESVRSTGRRVHTVATDVADPEQCQRLVDEAMAKFGRVDVLVNNAGTGTAVPATRETPEQFRSVIDVNLNGCYWMAQACGRVIGPDRASSTSPRSSASPPAGYRRRRTRLEGRPRRPHPRPGPAVDGPQGHPGQRAGAGLLRLQDDRDLSRRLPRPRPPARPGRPQGRPARARRDRGLAGVGRRAATSPAR